MAEKLQVYKCEKCGIMVEVLHEGPGTLVCCNEPMALLSENSTDAAQEKHVPVVERAEGSVSVSVGSVDHPMEEKHYIEWIELTADGKVFQHHLNPGDPPKATFATDAKNLTVRAYCNLHGLWRA